MSTGMDEPSHVLIVDDDRRIRELLASYLAVNGYRVTAAANALEARKAMAGLAFDVIVLDVMMPGESGLSFAADMRRAGQAVPILMLSARSDVGDRIKGLAEGSDDYLGKPFEPEELLLRLRNLLRRSATQPPKAKQLLFGQCLLELASGELSKAGERLHLTGREKEILKLLAQQPGEPVARSALLPLGTHEGARAIDVQINRLRQKIEVDSARPVFLQTVRGQGYVLFGETR